MDRSRPLTCLVAENEALIGMMIEEQLEELGLRVLGPYATSAAALASLEAATPDVALVDYLLRDGACTPITEELRRRGVPFAVLSGYDLPLHENRTQWIDVMWLRKPIPMDALQKVLRDLLPEL